MKTLSLRNLSEARVSWWNSTSNHMMTFYAKFYTPMISLINHTVQSLIFNGFLRIIKTWCMQLTELLSIS
jgi:hypothetical protein